MRTVLGFASYTFRSSKRELRRIKQKIDSLCQHQTLSRDGEASRLATLGLMLSSQAMLIGLCCWILNHAESRIHWSILISALAVSARRPTKRAQQPIHPNIIRKDPNGVIGVYTKARIAVVALRLPPTRFSRIR